jgi:hypothetical protein
VTRRHTASRDEAPAPVPVTDDDTGRRVAWQLSGSGEWLVLWGPWSRRWWAFPRFPGGDGIVHDSDPGELARQMRTAAIRAGRSPGRHA